MSFTMQFPNDTRLLHRPWDNKKVTPPEDGFLTSKDCTRTGLFGPFGNSHMFAFQQKMGNITPSLCFQSDVFYPNALAAVSAEGQVKSGEMVIAATGCRGNQVGRDYPLEARFPVALPLVQYPSATSEKFLDLGDICATPVLNWEKYVETLKTGRLKKRRTSSKSLHLNRGIKEGNKRDEKEGSVDEEEPKEVGSSLKDRKEIDSEEDINDTKEVTLTEDMEYLTQSKNYNPVIKYSHMRKALFQSANLISRKPKKGSLRVKSSNLALKIEKKYQHLTNLKPETLLKRGFQNFAIKNKNRVSDSGRIYGVFLKAIKNVPKLHIQSTWNYIYGGSSGALEFINENDPILYVANRTQLRKIELEKSSPAAIMSYKVKSVWEEDVRNVPTNNKPNSSYIDVLSDLIYQVKAIENFKIVGVRRGRSIELYSTENEAPYLLESVPNICYGTTSYKVGSRISKTEIVTDPLLFGVDFNPLYSPEFLTIDENKLIRLCDFAKGATISNYSMARSKRPTVNYPEFPKIRYVNDACGVQFGHHGHMFYGWNDSKVILGDTRGNVRARSPLTEIFDLRRSVSSISWSDQVFYNDARVCLNEYISCLKLSKKENYYFVGTTSRVFLMDVRVPGHPVLKMEHGLLAASYIDSYMDDNFEVLVCGEQRYGGCFSAVLDHAHVKCYDRKDCTQVNPVLHCLPRHLSNSREFFDTACASGFDFSNEAEHQKMKTHNYSWTTGLAIGQLHRPLKDPHGPPNISVFTSNCFGDVFYQELEQTPIENHRKYNLNNIKFTTFLKEWQSSMKSESNLEFLKPSINMFQNRDYSLLVEASTVGIPKVRRIRKKRFDILKPDANILGSVEKFDESFEHRMAKMREYQADISQRCLDFWEHSDSDDDEDEKEKC